MCTAPVENKQQVLQIDANQLNQLIQEKDIQLVDVRTAQEVSMGMIAQAVNLDFYEDGFYEKVSAMDKSKPIAVYCASGIRSGKASEEIIKMGFVQVYDLKDGFRGWQVAGLNTVEPE